MRGDSNRADVLVEIIDLVVRLVGVNHDLVGIRAWIADRFIGVGLLRAAIKENGGASAGVVEDHDGVVEITV